MTPHDTAAATTTFTSTSPAMPSALEHQLGQALLQHPARFGFRYSRAAAADLVELLFRSLTNYSDDYLRLLFPDGPGTGRDGRWLLTSSQGAVDGAEYTEAARGKRCGHIFAGGEAWYHCSTCSTDETCVLCSRCFDASDHTGHKYSISVSAGSTGCCDCGDNEAFRLPVLCGIHTDLSAFRAHAGHPPPSSTAADAARHNSAPTPALPPELVTSISTTIARALDYFCDIISCAPEQLRVHKTRESIRANEADSRLAADWYGGADPDLGDDTEYAVVLWNDEKHTVHEVARQVSRACRETEAFGEHAADVVNDVGRAVIKYSRDLDTLLRVARIIEPIRVTVTIRSARDTYREHMCATIVEWLLDIAPCRVGSDTDLLQDVVQRQLLRSWVQGSPASNADFARQGIDDHCREDISLERHSLGFMVGPPFPPFLFNIVAADTVDTDDDEGDGDGNADEEEGNEADEDDDLGEDGEAAAAAAIAAVTDFDDDDDDGEDIGDGDEMVDTVDTTDRGPFSPDQRDDDQSDTEMVDVGNDDSRAEGDGVHHDHETYEAHAPEHGLGGGGAAAAAAAHEPDTITPRYINIPQTPGVRIRNRGKAPSYWLVKPRHYRDGRGLPAHESVRQRTRLDWLIVFDLRLWKTTRISIRELCLSTVVKVPEFKRVLGLRFAVLYPVLAQLYLIADREPDHSIINLSMQLLSTPSITEEVVERGNFLTTIFAIIYTFLTTRQVGEPRDVNPSATLAADIGAVTPRRLYHFFHDFKYLTASPYVQALVRAEPQYLLQFLDLIKLPQGICPNKRAVTEHVEYEAENWLGTSLLMREINRICRQFCEAFHVPVSEPVNRQALYTAIVGCARVTMINSLGLERTRFNQAEVKDLVRFKSIPWTDFEVAHRGGGVAGSNSSSSPARRQHRVVDFVVENGELSFHHPLHYALSWLLECARDFSATEIRGVLGHAAESARRKWVDHTGATPHDLSLDDIVLATLDFPLRICAWFAQMKAGMWVRNGVTLRHQMTQYRAVVSRDMAYFRDIFLLQTAFSVCDPARFLASTADRFGLLDWMRGGFVARQGYDESHHVDVAEEFVHLLIIILTDRASLTFSPDGSDEADMRAIIRRDIAHILCFKPLTYTDLTFRIHDRSVESELFPDVLDEVATFRPPEGLSDSGTFELKEQYLDLVDPYGVQYSKNQREDAEHIYRRWIAKKVGIKEEADIVYEPHPSPIPPGGAYTRLSAFTKEPLFAQLIHQLLEYCLEFKDRTASIGITRIESLLYVLLQLMIVAVMDDQPGPDSHSFTHHALSKSRPTTLGDLTIVGLLQKVSVVPDYESCGPKIRYLLKRFYNLDPSLYTAATQHFRFPYDSIASSGGAGAVMENEKEAKKQQALARQAKVMQQFQEQQKNFLTAQSNIDWGEDLSDEEEEASAAAAATDATVAAAEAVVESSEAKMWTYPSGTCLLCQEDTDDGRLYGTFGLVCDSRILRQTPMERPEFIKEVLSVPTSLDQAFEGRRPWGVAGDNIDKIRRLDSTGGEVIAERIGLSQGFPPGHARTGPLVTGCGHLMHYSCFETYCAATRRRQEHQVARQHPEILERKEFVCPLCKALGNALLPIVWKGKEKAYPGVLDTRESFDDFLNAGVVWSISRFRSRSLMAEEHYHQSEFQELFADYVQRTLTSPLAANLHAWMAPESTPAPGLPELALRQHQARTSTALSNPNLAMLSGSLFPPHSPSPADESLAGTCLVAVGRPPAENPIAELAVVYSRLRDTFARNGITSSSSHGTFQQSLPDELTYVDAVVRSFGYSISAAEIAQRGVPAATSSNEPTTQLVEAMVPGSTLTSLRVLSETALSYIAIGALQGRAANKTVCEVREMYQAKLSQLLVGHLGIPGLKTLDDDDDEGHELRPLFEEDVFNFLAEASLTVLPALDVDPLHVVRLCYVAELVKIGLASMLNPSGLISLMDRNGDDDNKEDEHVSSETALTQEFLSWLIETYKISALHHRRRHSPPEPTQRLEASPRFARVVRKLLSAYALPFLRKTAVLLHVRYGLDLPVPERNGVESAGKKRQEEEWTKLPELDRLTALLRMPEIDDVLAALTAEGETNMLASLATGWIGAWSAVQERNGDREEDDENEAEGNGSSWRSTLSPPSLSPSSHSFSLRHARQLPLPKQHHHQPPPLTLSHPGIFELVGLPQYFDVLLDEAQRRTCPTTGKPLTDPALCLFCGAIFCSQAVCCTSRERGRPGGCNQHVER